MPLNFFTPLKHWMSAEFVYFTRVLGTILASTIIYACPCPLSQTDIVVPDLCICIVPTVVIANAMTPELAINLVCPGLIIPLGTIGNGLALWTLFLSDLLRRRVVRLGQLKNIIKKSVTVFALPLFSIFLICLYCADTTFLLSGYFGQWVINVSGFNVTDHVDFVSIRYDNETSLPI